MNASRSVLRLLVIALVSFTGPSAFLLYAAPAPVDQFDHDFDDRVDDVARLHLRDPIQEARTTSVNWLDSLLELRPTLSRPESLSGNAPLRLVIDPGHGGRDLGAQSGEGLFEKHLCLRMAKLIRTELQRLSKKRRLPLEVMLTREKDVYLRLGERVRRANAWGADLFVSIHANSAVDYAAARGFEVYFLNAEATDRAASHLAHLENSSEVAEPVKADVLSILSDVQKQHHIAQSSRFAEVVFESMASHLRSRARGVRQAPFTVLAGTEMPSLLVEVGYLTNEREARQLSQRLYLKRLAGAISNGIIDFAGRLGRRLSRRGPGVPPAG